MIPTLAEALESNSYPGRGLLLSTTPQGWCVVYFLTGRSASSQDRQIVPREDSIAIQAKGDHSFDPLRHYRAALLTPTWCVVGNGDQVETIATNLRTLNPREAVQGIEYEPDPPIRTPRISAVFAREEGESALVTRAYASVTNPTHTLIGSWSVNNLDQGNGILVTTYESKDGDVVSTNHPPIEVTVENTTPDGLVDEVWSHLPEKLRVGAVAISPSADRPFSGPVRTRS